MGDDHEIKDTKDNILLLPKKMVCEHNKVRVYAEKRDGKLVPTVVRCWHCGEEVKRRIVLVPLCEESAMNHIPRGAKVVHGFVSGATGPKPPAE